MPNGNRKPNLSRIEASMRASKRNRCGGCGGHHYRCVSRRSEDTGALIVDFHAELTRDFHREMTHH